MDTKLTLKLNAEVIRRAKEYASSQHRSLSSIVEAYLASLTSTTDQNQNNEEVEISPFVKSMATGVRIPTDIDPKSEYAKHLADKYR